ncbi:MAG: hypothetical protein ABIP53_09965, partial [Candidatus Limnocylindrales bacterium]
GADEWAPAVGRVIAAYQALGVEQAEMVSLQTTDLSDDLTIAAVNWRLVGAGGHVLYEFEAAYTLADSGGGLRITAIAHNETLRLMAALGRR